MILHRIDTMMFKPTELSKMADWFQSHKCGCPTGADKVSIFQSKTEDGFTSELACSCGVRFDFTDGS